MKRALFGIVLLASACDSEPPRAVQTHARQRGSAQVGGDVISTVDGFPIDRATVQQAVDAAGVAPELALRRLQDEEAVAAAAQRAGFDADAEVEAAARRASVQALLVRTVEAEVSADAVDEAQLVAAYEAATWRFSSPERRRLVRVVARVAVGDSAAEGDAHTWARALLGDAGAASDPEVVLLAVRHRNEETAFDVTVDETPPLAREEVPDPAAADALFSLTEAGLVPDVVRTRSGWEVMAVTEIEPASSLTREQALEQLRGEALARLRSRRLDELIARLAAERGVTLEPAGVDRLMRDANLLGPEE
jgi:hypothetical protein